MILFLKLLIFLFQALLKDAMRLAHVAVSGIT